MSSSTSTRTVKRTIISSGGGGDEISESSSSRRSNYQVYRGMSPTTSNRLEIRMKELEEALEQEREAHARTEQTLTTITIQLDSAHERLEEYEGKSTSQVDAFRKREQEVMKLKKDLELMSVQHEADLASMKKRNQDALNELNEQLDKANKQKSKVEKEKQQLLIEIDGFTSQLDGAMKAKNSAESRLEGLDDQLRRLKTQNEELTRQNQDLNNLKSRLTTEVTELQRIVHELESGSGAFSKSKSQMQTHIEELKSKYDEANRERNTMSIEINNLHMDFDKLHGQLEEEVETASSLRNQLQKSQAEFLALKSKYDKDVSMRADELDEMRRKLTARITELESLYEAARSKAGKLEKDKNRWQTEIRELTIQIEATNASFNDCVKRIKQLESINGDLQRRCDDSGGELQAANSEMSKLTMEITRLKTVTGDMQAKIDALTRDNNKLTEALREAESNSKDFNRQIQELTSIRIQIQNERDSLAATAGDAQEACRDLQMRLEAANAALSQAMSNLDHRLREKDDEMENSRKNSQRTIDELQRSITEIETKYKSEIGRLKKKQDSEHHEIIIQIENANRTCLELTKNNKNLATRLKELETLLDSERRTVEELRESSTVTERKLIAVQTELEDVRGLLETSERARKGASEELNDSTTHINEIKISISQMTNEKRRLEADLQGIQVALDDAISARRAADDRSDRLQLELNRLSDQLRHEQEIVASTETMRKQYEIQIREITLRLEEAESHKDGKKPLAKLQARVYELETALEHENNHSANLMADNKKLLRQLQELRVSSDQDRHLVTELTENINNLNIRITTIKRQLEDAEEVLGITMAKYRKTQQLLEDAERRADRADKNASTMMRQSSISISGGMGGISTIGLGGRGVRSMSVSRELTRVVRV